jgi:ABC-type ATPase involved in cell division
LAQSIAQALEKLKTQGFTLLIAEQNQILSGMADQVLRIAGGHLTGAE